VEVEFRKADRLFVKICHQSRVEAMKVFLVLVMILTPCTSFAVTDCKVVENANNFEAVCVGDEKTPPVTEGNTNSKSAAPDTKVFVDKKSVSSAGAGETAARPSSRSLPAPTGSSSARRQGRQKYQQGREEARARRDSLLSEHQQTTVEKNRQDADQ
jgi:hypothetical protein